MSEVKVTVMSYQRVPIGKILYLTVCGFPHTVNKHSNFVSILVNIHSNVTNN